MKFISIQKQENIARYSKPSFAGVLGMARRQLAGTVQHVQLEIQALSCKVRTCVKVREPRTAAPCCPRWPGSTNHSFPGTKSHVTAKLTKHEQSAPSNIQRLRSNFVFFQIHNQFNLHIFNPHLEVFTIREQKFIFFDFIFFFRYHSNWVSEILQLQCFFAPKEAFLEFILKKQIKERMWLAFSCL